MPLKTYLWDMAYYIDDYEDVDGHIKLALEDYDPVHMEDVLSDIVRSKAMAKLAAKWEAPDGCIGTYINGQTRKVIDACVNQLGLVEEIDRAVDGSSGGGYASGRLTELVRNCADNLSRFGPWQIWMRLAPTHLYFADDGEPIDAANVDALMFSHLPPAKRGGSENGGFRLDFRSALGVADSPEFFSRSGSFRFCLPGPRGEIGGVASEAARYPSLRLPEAIHPIREAALDPVLRDLMERATNIVRLPLKPDAYESLAQQIEKFPADILLSVQHAGRLILHTDQMETARIIALDREGDEWTLEDAGTTSHWRVEKRLHKLPSLSSR